MSTSVQKQAFEAFQEAAKDLLGSSLDRLVLYGSVARDEEREDSDVDVFAVVENKEDLEQLRELAFDIGVLEYGVSISVQGTIEEEFEGFSNSSYLRKIREEGVEYVRG